MRNEGNCIAKDTNLFFCVFLKLTEQTMQSLVQKIRKRTLESIMRNGLQE